MKNLKKIGVIILSIVMILNSIIAIVYTIMIKKYKHTVIAIILLASTFILMEMDSIIENRFLIKKYNLADRDDLILFYFDDISYRYPEYSLIKTPLTDGYHEQVKEVGKEKYTHQMSVEDGEYTTYNIVDEKGKLIENKLKELYKQQLENFKKAHLDKKVVVSEGMYRSYYSNFGILFMLVSMGHTFFVLRMREEEVSVERGTERIILEPSEEAKEVAVAEENLEEGLQEAFVEIDAINNSSNNSIDVNTAQEANFSSLNGISTIQAKYLVKEREDNGNYKSITDFFSRNAISERLQKELKPHLIITSFNDNSEDNNRGRVLDF